MSFLVDTHVLIWSLVDPSRIRARAAEVLVDPDSVKYASKISFWEIALKYALGRLELRGTTPEGLLRSSRDAGYQLLDVTAEDLATSHRLPAAENHRDPFDRLIIWQCMRNDLVLMTGDSRIAQYARHGLRLIE